MQVQLEQVRQKPFRWDEVQHIAVERLERSEVVELGDVAWWGDIRYAAPGFHLVAAIEYEQTLECARCLQPMARSARAELELMVFIGEGDASPGDHELEESDLGVLYLDSDILDLEPLLLEQLQLNVPMHALCKEDCAGLCPVCGADRNREMCDCEPEPADPRWAGLTDLKAKLGSDEADG
jgi:uncharacterized protein